MRALRTVCILALVGTWAGTASAQKPQTQPAPARPALPPPPAAGGTVTPRGVAGAIAPPDYVIGVDDVLVVMFWRDKDMSSEVVVRPDGKITLPLINDVVAAGLTPDQLRERVSKEAERFIEEPAASIVVKQINSRKVFITGEVEKPGPYSLSGPTTVLQLISMAGGLREYAHKGDIIVMRNEAGKVSTFQFDYGAVARRKKLHQNILLKPGDTVVVP